MGPESARLIETPPVTPCRHSSPPNGGRFGKRAVWERLYRVGRFKAGLALFKPIGRSRFGSFWEFQSYSQDTIIRVVKTSDGYSRAYSRSHGLRAVDVSEQIAGHPRKLPEWLLRFDLSQVPVRKNQTGRSRFILLSDLCRAPRHAHSVLWCRHCSHELRERPRRRRLQMCQLCVRYECRTCFQFSSTVYSYQQKEISQWLKTQEQIQMLSNQLRDIRVWMRAPSLSPLRSAA